MTIVACPVPSNARLCAEVSAGSTWPTTTLEFSSRSALKLRYRIIRPDNSGLYISPEADSRVVAPGGSDEIRMFPLGSALQAEYAFQLGLATASVRRIVVRIPNLQAALQARASRSSEAVEAMVQFLGSQPDPVAFNSLSVSEKNRALADAAHGFIASNSLELPDHENWIVTADTLSRIGMAETAITALQTAETKSPEITQSASVRNLAAVLSAQSGKHDVLDPAVIPSVGLGEIKIQDSDLVYATAAQREKWSILSERLERLSGFKSEALMIKGDVLDAGGDKAKAAQLYQRAIEVKPTPRLNNKLERARNRAG
ncbi:MAG: hypothetical protein IPK54_07720 [Dokdonella sp.]|uniref:hypothetical protein n=1 Tax=Dokdonella sp. TaxID=2291710 RepID=UPI0025BD9221|nr:hypothetical protein [Dokdonella sp.]MBK8123430.1 hypothetical protein [Dokdonella sp.]